MPDRAKPFGPRRKSAHARGYDAGHRARRRECLQASGGLCEACIREAIVRLQKFGCEADCKTLADEFAVPSDLLDQTGHSDLCKATQDDPNCPGCDAIDAKCDVLAMRPAPHIVGRYAITIVGPLTEPEIQAILCRIEQATVADHVVPHRGDVARLTDQANYEALCKRHHAEKTARGD